MRAVGILFAVLAAIASGLSMLLAGYTSHKLDLGRMVRGELPGATFFDGEVLETEPVPGALPDQCALVVGFVSDGVLQTTREWANEPACAAMPVGSHVRLAMPGNEPDLYLPTGTWASPGNAAFDAMLVKGEHVAAGVFAVASVALGMAVQLARRRRPATK